MAEVISLMDIDEDNNHWKQKHSQKLNKGKSVITASDSKAAHWVEKYRPQTLTDVVTHHDIVDTISL
ncbi:hypothetical protein REPUB_Repub09cG0059900 [Reevesia pubescens]